MMSEEDIPPLSPFYSLFIRQLEQLENAEAEDETEGALNDRIFQYLAQVSAQDDLKVNDYFKDLPWLNVSQPLSLHEDLAGLLVVIDFFTYCCINCLHMLPFLDQFEANLGKSKSSMALLGVHSPKFENEKPLASVASALLRHNITHPVANDPELRLWNALNISCWPTVVLIGPDGRLLFYLVGETSITSRLKLYVDASLRFYEQKLTGSTANLRISLLKDSTASAAAAAAEKLLYFPTKLALSPSGEKVAITNSLKHSIVVATRKDGLVLHIIGSNDPNKSGFKDGPGPGPLESALFNSPQGVAWQSEEVLFVCDTENHAIRRVDLKTGQVRTVAGNGRQSEDKAGGRAGRTEQGLNSPWDVVCDAEKRKLYIAMAGSHQIWQIPNLDSGDDDDEEEDKICSCIAGDGNEEKRNNRFPLKASFAQPSGIALSPNRQLFIADSESSSIRVVELLEDEGAAAGAGAGAAAGAVSTLVGGGLDPRDLFAFGDVDGKGSKARLQHPMGVCVKEDSLYIADTFNHKIKKVTLSSKHCQTVEIKDSDSDDGGALALNEPNGLCFYSEDELLIADTNNHRILRLNLTTGVGEEFKLIQLPPEPAVSSDVTDSSSTSSRKSTSNRQRIQSTKELLLCADGRRPLQVELRFRSFSGGFKATPEAVQKIQITEASSHEALGLLSISPSSLVVTNLEQSGAVQFSVCCSSSAAAAAAAADKNKESLPLKISILGDLNLCNEVLSCCKCLPLQVDVPVRIVDKAADKQCIEIDA